MILNASRVEATSPDAAAEAKREFHLFNPTRRELMREMSTDRPDTTESPVTVDAGHFQLEMSFVDYTHDDRNRDSQRTETLIFGAMNLKAGVLRDVDVQLVFDSYVRDRTSDQAAATSDVEEGFGDTQVRVKWNLWGNDPPEGGQKPGDTALALMPFVKFPTADDDLGNEHVEGGLIVPLSIELPAEFSLGLMAEFDAVYDEDDSDYDLEFVHTATVGRDLVGDLGGYVEYIGVATTDSEEYAATVGCGLTYGLTEDIQLDAGVNFGLTTPADDFNAFVGLSVRY